MRVRVISQTFTDLWRNREMLNPFHSGFYAIELISHKVLRYAVPFFLVLSFFSSLIAAFSSKFFLVVFLIQIVFYFMALIGWIFEKSGKSSGFSAMPFYFVLANVASIIAFYEFLRGKTYARWETIRENA